MDKFDEYGTRAWTAVINKIEALCKNGHRQQEVAETIGVSKSTLSNWRSGGRKAQNASFADMLRYIDRLGLDISEFIPVSLNDCSELKSELDAAKKRIIELEAELAEAKGNMAGMQKALEMTLAHTLQSRRDVDMPEKSCGLPELKSDSQDAG